MGDWAGTQADDSVSGAADYESGGQEFESLRARQKPNKYQNNLHARKGAMQNKIICMASAWPRGAWAIGQVLTFGMDSLSGVPGRLATVVAATSRWGGILAAQNRRPTAKLSGNAASAAQTGAAPACRRSGTP